MTPACGTTINSVPDTVLVMAAAHRAWAKRFMPWLLKDVR